MYTILLLLAVWTREAPPEPLAYFLTYRTDRCWVLDNSQDPEVVSVAANGFGMAAWAVAAQHGMIARTQALTWINRCLDETLRVNRRNRGWCYHFMDRQGNPLYDRLVSSVDTALFYLGARHAAHLLQDPELIRKVEQLIAQVDRSVMLQGKYFSHGFYWAGDRRIYSDWNWVEYSEGVLIYKLFGVPYEHPPVRYDLALFVYYYPLCFYTDQDLVDDLGKALDWQRREMGACGFTACDGPAGYQVMGRDVVSPLALATCERFYPEKVAVDSRTRAGVKPDRTISACTVSRSWQSTRHIAIDEGAYVLITNRLMDKSILARSVDARRWGSDHANLLRGMGCRLR